LENASEVNKTITHQEKPEKYNLVDSRESLPYQKGCRPLVTSARATYHVFVGFMGNVYYN
jgi:hypothetical protein